MRVTPLDIINKEFTALRKGYDPAEVRQFLEEVRDTLEETLKEQHRLQEELRLKDEELRRLRANEDQIKDTLVLARKLSEDLEGGARREADLVIGEARLEAQRIIASTHDHHRDLLSEITQLKGQRVRLVAELRALLGTHSRLLDELDGPER